MYPQLEYTGTPRKEKKQGRREKGRRGRRKEKEREKVVWGLIDSAGAALAQA